MLIGDGLMSYIHTRVSPWARSGLELLWVEPLLSSSPCTTAAVLVVSSRWATDPATDRLKLPVAGSTLNWRSFVFPTRKRLGQPTDTASAQCAVFLIVFQHSYRMESVVDVELLSKKCTKCYTVRHSDHSKNHVEFQQPAPAACFAAKLRSLDYTPKRPTPWFPTIS